MMVLALVLKVLTSLALMLMTLAQSHFHWWILRLSSISKKGLTHSPNNIGLRDASASKKSRSQKTRKEEKGDKRKEGRGRS